MRGRSRLTLKISDEKFTWKTSRPAPQRKGSRRSTLKAVD